MVRARNVNRTKAVIEVPDWEQEEFQSRTQIKLAAQAVVDLGLQLSEMTLNEIKKLALPAKVEEAVIMLKNLDKGPALKRQRLFVGKLLRQNEHFIVEIKEKLAEKELKAKQQNAYFHQLEKWRDRLVEEGDTALTPFMEKFPHADRQQLRQWIRNAQKELETKKPPKASREIFKYLKALEW